MLNFRVMAEGTGSETKSAMERTPKNEMGAVSTKFALLPRATSGAVTLVLFGLMLEAAIGGRPLESAFFGIGGAIGFALYHWERVPYYVTAWSTAGLLLATLGWDFGFYDRWVVYEVATHVVAIVAVSLLMAYLLVPSAMADELFSRCRRLALMLPVALGMLAGSLWEIGECAGFLIAGQELGAAPDVIRDLAADLLGAGIASVLRWRSHYLLATGPAPRE